MVRGRHTRCLSCQRGLILESRWMCILFDRIVSAGASRFIVEGYRRRLMLGHRWMAA